MARGAFDKRYGLGRYLFYLVVGLFFTIGGIGSLVMYGEKWGILVAVIGLALLFGGGTK